MVGARPGPTGPQMNEHALTVLEFRRVLSLVAERASSALGAERVRALVPSTDRVWLEREHARVAAMRALVAGEGGWRAEPIPDLTRALDRLRIAGAPWAADELLAAGVLLHSSRRTRATLTDERRRSVATAVLAPFAERLVDEPKVEAAIARAIADDATVKDEASPALRGLRRDLRGSQGELVRLLERIVARLEPHQSVADMSVTVRNGRYVIPIRREARGAVGGIVHDTSATGATLFVEPPAAVEFGNRIRELEAEERREVDRILHELTDVVRPFRDELLGALDALVGLDALHARARFAEEFRCAPAELGAPADGFAILHGRHPLLLAQGVDVVPFDLTMESGDRTLLVSGPNTGGKTVLLKAVGLISALVQAGAPAPVGAGSRVAIFDDYFADIGDEQSIQASLSTFSAHLKNLGEILRKATPSSLVLVDELGSGTDPVEGAALGGAILDELTRRGTITLATTHLGALKELAADVPGVVNASLQFDAVALAPTYRLIKGIPGRSYGLSIARRLDLPPEILDRAEARLPAGERDVERLLAELERREAELADREREAAAMADESRQRTASVLSRERVLRERERELERQSRAEARRYVLEARAEIERTIAELRERGASGLDEAAREARQHVERLANEQRRAVDAMEPGALAPARHRVPAQAIPIESGDWVQVGTLGGRTGRVLDVRADSAVVAVGGMKVTVPLSSLERTRRRDEPAAEAAVALVGDIPDVEAKSEVDLRGLRVDETDAALYSALDAAIRADFKSLRIIHGKGTGALRARVSELLRKDTRVAHFRLGAWNEGGTGVTVAELA